ncbi:MAG: hypothetical protein ACOYXO_09095 [Chloroflexota bacterium]
MLVSFQVGGHNQGQLHFKTSALPARTSPVTSSSNKAKDPFVGCVEPAGKSNTCQIAEVRKIPKGAKSQRSCFIIALRNAQSAFLLLAFSTPVRM